MEGSKKTPTEQKPTHHVRLKCNNVVRAIDSRGELCPRCGFRLVSPPEYSGWEPLDITLFKFSNTLLNVQKLTSIWTWIATEETRPEDVERVLPPVNEVKETSQKQDTYRRKQGIQRSPSLLWWILTLSVLAIVLYVVLIQ